MTKLSKSILEKIKGDQIKPIPRWRFALMHVLLWVSVLIAIFVGSIATSVIVRVIAGAKWDIIMLASGGKFHSFILVLPYIWLGLLALVIFLAGKLFEKTKKGYKYGHFIVALSTVFISVCLGTGLYLVGIGHSVHTALSDNVTPYAKWQDVRDKVLVAPDRGFLAGRVMEASSDEEIIVVDFMKTKWEVDISNANIEDARVLQKGYPIGIKGKKIDDNSFDAKHVMQLREPPKNLRKMSMPQFKGRNR